MQLVQPQFRLLHVVWIRATVCYNNQSLSSEQFELQTSAQILEHLLY